MRKEISSRKNIHTQILSHSIHKISEGWLTVTPLVLKIPSRPEAKPHVRINRNKYMNYKMPFSDKF